MKLKYGFILSAMTIFTLLAGCGEGQNISEKSGDSQTSSVSEKSVEKESLKDEEKGESMEENIAFFIEKLGLSETRAKGNAQILEDAGCGTIVDYEDKTEVKNAYTITLINNEGEKYFTAFDIDGFIGPVKDEAGEYLYSPVD